MAEAGGSCCCFAALAAPPVFSREANGDATSAVVCVVDTAARVVRCHLLPAAPVQSPYNSSSSTSRYEEVASQLTALLEQLLWWRDADVVVAYWSVADDSELQVRIVEAIEKVVSRVEILQTPAECDSTDCPRLPQEALLRVSCLLKRPDVLHSWSAEFPAQFGWFLLELHGIFDANQMLDEPKYEGAFELELRTDAISAHMRCARFFGSYYQYIRVHIRRLTRFGRLNPAAKLAFASSNPHHPSVLKMISPFCRTKAGRKLLAQVGPIQRM